MNIDMLQLSPGLFERKILLSVVGLAPQVVTETLYGLVTSENPFIPDEIHLITTAKGAERAKLLLLDESPGWFRRLLMDYGLPEIIFNENHIHIVRSPNGSPLQDIRSAEDNELVADFISEKVRYFTEDSNCALHVSIAGGRKTMGFYLGYALSLYGRPQDRLSHVLVSSSYESNPEFFYPTPNSCIIRARSPGKQSLDTKQAKVVLAEIPFVRLRRDLSTRITSKEFSFKETVEAAQRQESKPKLVIGMEHKTIQVGDEEVHLAPAEFAFYTWMAKRRSQRNPPVHWTDRGIGQEYLEHYKNIVGPMAADFDRVAAALHGGMTKDYFDFRKSKTNGSMKDVLGYRTAEPYLIKPHGSRPKTRFGVSLAVDAIVFI